MWISKRWLIIRGETRDREFTERFSPSVLVKERTFSEPLNFGDCGVPFFRGVSNVGLNFKVGLNTGERQRFGVGE